MEIATIVNVGMGEGNPTINLDAFPNNGNYHYWTSSEYPPVPAIVQYTNFETGNQFKWIKKGFMRVRCVRGGGWDGNYPADDDFTITEKTVMDNITCLEWEQKSWGGGEDDEPKEAIRDVIKMSGIILHERQAA